MTWERLECATVGADLLGGQEGRVADGMWMIGRQWQVGELTGDDAASPLLVELDLESTPVSRFQPGAPDERHPVVDVAALDEPLEVAVEADDPWASPAAARLAAEAGLQLLRLLAAAGAGPVIGVALRKAFALVLPDDDGQDPVGRAELELLARRSFDARALRASADRPPQPLREPRLASAFTTWVAWYDSLFGSGAAGAPSWQPSRMEHRFRLGARPAGHDEVTLEAPEYPGGRLDWHAFDVVEGSSLGAEPALAERHVTVIPTAATYAGQAASRWWQLEDGAVWFGDLHAAPEDLAHVAVAAFGLSFGDDWYRVPVRVRSNHLARVSRLVVIDSFGRRHRIRSCAELDGPGRPWRFFELTGDPGADAALLDDRRSPWLYAAPVVAATTEGRPREEVVLSRDETTNVGWAAERRVEATSGRVVDRVAGTRQAPPPPAVTPPGDAWRYQLAPPVPGHLVPLLPVELEGGAGLYLQRGRVATASSGDGPPATRGAVGRILEPDRRLLIEDAEVPTSGATVTRSWQLTRTSTGRVVLWLGRRKGSAGPRRDPALTFDTVEQSP